MTSLFHSSELSEKLLTQAFPFHIVIDDLGSILSFGEPLARKIGQVHEDNKSLFDHFTFQHPSGVKSVADLAKFKNKLFLLASKKHSDLVLRGQLVVNENQSHFVFLISPWVTDVDVLDSLGFSLNDFPVHSPMSDFLILVQAQKVSLDDSMRLSDELTHLNKELEERVLRRTKALERQAEELLESKSVLEREMKERERVEVELRHAQKLESVGQLAAGIAHEINTPMQYIGSSLSFLNDSFSDLESLNKSLNSYLSQDCLMADPKVMEFQEKLEDADLDYLCERGPKALNRALEGIARVTEIVSAMNEFTHPDRKEKDNADINRALGTVLTVASNEYKYVARIETDLQEIPLIDCYLGDLNQVFLNLVVNAAHAIAENNVEEGTIKVSTRMENGSVVVSVADNGTGIPKDIQHRIFDPFFTTKEVGRGTGQGLSISHNIIVEKHGGRLYFETSPKHGTTFFIELPIASNNNGSLSPQLEGGRDLAA